MDDTVEERLKQLEHSNQVILQAITDMKIKDQVDYIKSKQDLYTVVFVPDGMQDRDVVSTVDKHFTSKRLAKERIEHLEKTRLRKNDGKYIYVIGSIDTRGDN